METLRIEHDAELPGLVTVTLNRPEKLNAISFRMHEDIQEACRQLRDDTSARVVIFTGEGRAFSAGADLGGSAKDASTTPLVRDDDPLRERHRAGIGSRTAQAIEDLDQVTIGAVNGLAIGGAVVFLACMDIRLAASTAWFSIPEVELQIPLTWNSLPRLMRELGPARTKELVMACDRFSAEDALRWGLLNHVVPAEDLMPRTRALASRLLAMNPMALALTKSTTRAIANSMAPIDVSHADRDYLMMARMYQRKPTE